MKKISAREYRKHYILNLLPSASSDDELTYIVNPEEVEGLDKWISLMTRLIINEPLLAKSVNLRTEQLKKNGGALVSVKTIYLPINETPPAQLVYLDLSYAVTKDVQFFIGGRDVTQLVSKSDKLAGLVTRFMRELYAGYKDNYSSENKDAFINEVYLLDDIEMVVDENCEFKINVDRSLRDYLVALNARLRVSA